MLARSEMAIQLLTVWASVSSSFTGILSSIWGKVVVASLFVAGTFAGISGLIHLTLLLCLVDLILGVSVTIKRKGICHIMSSKLRDSLVKVFFYLILLMLLFLIETQIVDGYFLTSKVLFSVIAGVELLSITANMLILFPKFPLLRIFNKFLKKELCKKLELTEEELEDELYKISN